MTTQEAEISLPDFWKWAYSDLLSNLVRPVFAEYIVKTALEIESPQRKDWEPVDLKYGAFKIEVKSSAYLQSWFQKGPSVIKFGIAEALPWDSTTNIMSDVAQRSSDCYVFCLYTEMDKATANPTDLNKWEFYTVATPALAKTVGKQKTIGLTRLRRLASPVSYASLKASVDTTLKMAGLTDVG